MTLKEFTKAEVSGMHFILQIPINYINTEPQTIAVEVR